MISSIKITIFIATVFFLTACKTIPTTPDDVPVPEPKQTSPSSTGSTTQNSTSQSSSNNEPEQNSGEDATNANAAANLTSEEEAQQLDQQLDERFADFDRLLLREREFLNEKQKEQGEPQNSSDGTTGGDGLDGLEGLDGFDDIASDDSSSQNGTSSTQQTAGENSYPSNNTNINTPPDLVNGKGDGVIARQLREAAQKEKDPVLREKLWDEYRKYKSGI